MAALKKLIPSRPFRLARDGEGSAAWDNATTNATCRPPSQIKGSTGSARERHGLFRCGAFERPVLAARRSNYSGVVLPPQARIAGRLTFQPVARFRPSG